jgi:hypothetical protein
VETTSRREREREGEGEREGERERGREGERESVRVPSNNMARPPMHHVPTIYGERFLERGERERASV